MMKWNNTYEDIAKHRKERDTKENTKKTARWKIKGAQSKQPNSQQEK